MLNLRRCSKIVLSEIVQFVKVSIIVIRVHITHIKPYQAIKHIKPLCGHSLF